MEFELRFPDIGEGVAEGEIVRWLVAEGTPVKEDDLLVEILTDKAAMEMPVCLKRVRLNNTSRGNADSPVFASIRSSRASTASRLFPWIMQYRLNGQRGSARARR